MAARFTLKLEKGTFYFSRREWRGSVNSRHAEDRAGCYRWDVLPPNNYAWSLRSAPAAVLANQTSRMSPFPAQRVNRSLFCPKRALNTTTDKGYVAALKVAHC
jgi:hypothetical protein